MPNWIKNIITIKSPNKDHIEILLNNISIYDKENNIYRLDFNKISPQPIDITTEKIEYNGIIYEPADNGEWYDWRYKNWGCKWNCTIYDDSYGGELCNDNNIYNIYFDINTPWTTPEKIYNAIYTFIKNYKLDIHILVKYSEEFSGAANGEYEITNEEYLTRDYRYPTLEAAESFKEVWMGDIGFITSNTDNSKFDIIWDLEDLDEDDHIIVEKNSNYMIKPAFII